MMYCVVLIVLYILQATAVQRLDGAIFWPKDIYTIHCINDSRGGVVVGVHASNQCGVSLIPAPTITSLRIEFVVGSLLSQRELFL